MSVSVDSSILDHESHQQFTSEGCKKEKRVRYAYYNNELRDLPSVSRTVAIPLEVNDSLIAQDMRSSRFTSSDKSCMRLQQYPSDQYRGRSFETASITIDVVIDDETFSKVKSQSSCRGTYNSRLVSLRHSAARAIMAT
jgi:hypothetical protein